MPSAGEPSLRHNQGRKDRSRASAKTTRDGLRVVNLAERPKGIQMPLRGIVQPLLSGNSISRLPCVPLSYHAVYAPLVLNLS